jgi:hypothetical protein
MMESHWREPGYTVPNATVYPHQWLWDSCFHALIWAELGRPDRAITELECALGSQDEAGFVPHMRYWADPQMHADFWGAEAASSITQPPMYGYAIHSLLMRGVVVRDQLIERALSAFRFLLHERARCPRTGLVQVCHPWETGADNSPRWDDFAPHPFEPVAWKVTKGDLVQSIERNAVGSPVANPGFPVAPISFNALLAWNALMLGEAIGSKELKAEGRDLAGAIDRRWDPDRVTFLDGRVGRARSGAVRTLDSLLPVLLFAAAPGERTEIDLVFRLLFDHRAYGGPCGPAGVHRDEPAFEPRTYWRGPAWPQLTFLFWQAARSRGRPADARRLAHMLVDGAERSRLAEYWDPDDGTGLGAAPQSWTGLALLAEVGLED